MRSIWAVVMPSPNSANLTIARASRRASFRPSAASFTLVAECVLKPRLLPLASIVSAQCRAVSASSALFSAA